MQKSRIQGFYGWKMLAVMCIVLFANSGFPMYGGSVVNTYMAASLHFHRSELGLVFALFQFMLALPAPLAAICINKKGVRFTLVLGTFLIVAGALVMAVLVRNPIQAYLGFGIIIGLGSLAGGPLTAQAGIARWFVKRRALAISLILTGGAIGGLIAPLLLNWIIESFHGNWRVAWWFVAGITFVAALLALFFVKEWPSDVGQLPDGASSAEPGPSAAPSNARAAVYRTTEQWTFAEVAHVDLLAALLVRSGIPHRVYPLSCPRCGSSPGPGLYTSAGRLLAFVDDAGFFAQHAAGGSLGTISNLACCWAAAMLLFGGGMLLFVHPTGALGLYLYAILLGAGSALLTLAP